MFDFSCNQNKIDKLKQEIINAYRVNEKDCVIDLLEITADINTSIVQKQKINDLATKLITSVRKKRINGFGVDALMQEFKLSSIEGVALMCLAESLLRIPDKVTQIELIGDRVKDGDWKKHIKTGNIFVNATSWGLLITGKLTQSVSGNELSQVLLNLVAKCGEPIIRKAVQVAVKLMGNQFVMSETIDLALKKAKIKENKGYRFSYDMLGEAAMTEDDAMLYMQSYIDAIHRVGEDNNNVGVYKGAGISVKLSAIHSRYERSQSERVMSELYDRLKQLFLLAKKYQIGLFIDAEESKRLMLSLDLFEKLVLDPDLKGFKGFGFVVQSYQKRATHVIKYLVDLAKRSQNILMVRLVKGAYWDSEIKQAQVDGQLDYPVFTRKFYTDLSYLACAKILFANQDVIYPLFATHNAHTVASIYEMGLGHKYEFQCLYGMGETLYDNIIGESNLNIPCRVYAPVGTYTTLLAYLVRRLLENGANSSFVHQIVDAKISVDQLLQDPIELSRLANGESNKFVPLPLMIYPEGRINSKGLDLTDDAVLSDLQIKCNQFMQNKYNAYSLIYGVSSENKAHLDNIQYDLRVSVYNPADKLDKVGEAVYATLNDVDNAINIANTAFITWSKTEVSDRAKVLLKMADLLETNTCELLALIVREAGKTLSNAINEIREAVDFCRYYANYAMLNFNNKTHHPLGVFVCISPWNFPLAIFIGEISSAIVTGNTVIAKPAEQTSLIAFYAVKLLHQSGVPLDVLQLLLGRGEVIGNALTIDHRVKGVIFTGSTTVAQLINRNLAKKDFESVLIAETGGQNAMIVDSSALPEQVITDVLASGFDSAGQRCSALRVLYLQNDVADKMLHMLKGAMSELCVGNPNSLKTDIGPVIDEEAQNLLLKHIEYIKPKAKTFYQTSLSPECKNGFFVAPTIVEIDNIKELTHEVFGPVVHVIKFKVGQLDNVIAEINSSGFGLTQGLHSRIKSHAVKVLNNINAGNIYINRNMVGAVVGVQPFGGEGMSGTGPKAGGPLYLYRLVNTKLQPSFAVTQNYSKMVQQYISYKFSFSKLDCFMANLSECGFDENELLELSNYSNIVKQQTLLLSQLVFSGSTGELNFMFFVKRGTVALFANSKYEYALQIIASLATDNDVILPSNTNTQIFSNKLPNQSLVYRCINNDTNAEVINICNIPTINLALISKNYPNKTEVKVNLAKRDGALVTLVYQQDNIEYPLYLLTAERSVSVNITATGGNIELMNLVDELVGTA